MSKIISEDAASDKIIRAGATYPTAVPSSYFQPAENPHPTGRLKERIVLSSNKNTCPRPAFGATRDEGGVGPLRALPPCADVVDYNRRDRNSVCLKLCGRRATPLQGTLEAVPRGPTAEKIISMTAAGKKPPVPDEEQIERQKKYISKISENMTAAVVRHVNDENIS